MIGTGHGRQQFTFRMHFNLVIAQQPRPFARNIVKQGVRSRHFSKAAFRGFNAIVPGQAANRQHFLHRGITVARAAVDPLEAVIAADHHQRPPAGHVIMQER